MKKIIAGILFVLLTVLCFAGCNAQEADEENSSVVQAEKNSPLIGCWVYENGGTKSAMQFFSNGRVVTATTESNGRLWIKKCATFFTENDFLCIYEEDAAAPQTAQFSINGNELTIQSVTSASDNYHASDRVEQTFVKSKNSIEEYLLAQYSEVEMPTTTTAPTITSVPNVTSAPARKQESTQQSQVDSDETPTHPPMYMPSTVGPTPVSTAPVPAPIW